MGGHGEQGEQGARTAEVPTGGPWAVMASRAPVRPWSGPVAGVARDGGQVDARDVFGGTDLRLSLLRR
ncbi:hypothetical protein ACQPZZ_35775 [Microbispora sp. CA-135349]|uniref:hypothetical protein n=1 Tax=Microbispora sp. CA-135349 TaxID=3239953 RepID=UPI003D8E8201